MRALAQIQSTVAGFAVFAAFALFAGAAVAAADPVTGLPSCTVLPAESPGLPPGYINVDAQGRFYSIQVTGNPGEPLTSSFGYQTSDELEGICSLGRYVAFWGADRIPLRPGRYIDILEFINAGLVHNYFLSATAQETALIQSGKVGTGWEATPLRLRVPRVGADLVPVHRFLGSDEPGVVTHFFTADAVEIAAWQAKVAEPATATRWWKYEGIAFYAPRVDLLNGAATCSDSTLRPVYRVSGVLNGKTQPKYRYVANPSTITSMKALGFVVDRPAFCALSD